MKSLLFKSDMLKAELIVLENGGEAQTRRLDGLKEINIEPDKWRIYDKMPTVDGPVCFEVIDGDMSDTTFIKPRYPVGEVVYFKEAFMVDKEYDRLKMFEILEVGRKVAIWYYADGNHYADKVNEGAGKLRSPLFMPAWAARHFAWITGIGIGRLQEITEEDAKAEGFSMILGNMDRPSARWYFKNTWDSLYPKYPWNSNPYCWNITFKIVPRPEAWKINVRRE